MEDRKKEVTERDRNESDNNRRESKPWRRDKEEGRSRHDIKDIETLLKGLMSNKFTLNNIFFACL